VTVAGGGDRVVFLENNSFCLKPLALPSDWAMKTLQDSALEYFCGRSCDLEAVTKWMGSLSKQRSGSAKKQQELTDRKHCPVIRRRLCCCSRYLVEPFVAFFSRSVNSSLTENFTLLDHFLHQSVLGQCRDCPIHVEPKGF
jgi:hypothetical protein